jgi:hypothetical protein
MTVPTYPSYPAQVIPTHTPVVQVSLAGTVTITTTVTIASGTALSTAVDMTQPALFGYTPIAIILPSAWTSANLSIQSSLDGITFGEFHTFTVGNYVTSSALAANEGTSLNGYPLRGVPFFRIRSGLVGAPVNQGATRVITVICGTV